jgi:TrmH family RNA methyltransferase
MGLYAIEGVRLHERALRSGTRVERAVACDSLRQDPSPRVGRLLSGLRESGCELHFADAEQLRSVTEERADGAIVGLVELPRPGRLEALFDGPAAPSTVVVAVDVEDPGNAGALVRTALASGAAGLVAVGVTDPYHPRAVRISRGSLFKLPIFPWTAAESLLPLFRERGVTTVGAVASGGEAPFDVAFGQAPVALFLGSEALGLPGELQLQLDRRLSIPMAAGVDSHSVNAAAAILLYELRRPR